MPQVWKVFGRTLRAAGAVLAFLLPAAGAQAMHFKIVYSFKGDSNSQYDGDTPTGALVADSAGNLYGTTVFGGQELITGTVFKLAPNGTETVIASLDGDITRGPLDGVAMDRAGNFYGVIDEQPQIFRIASNGVQTFMGSPFWQYGAAERLLVDKAGNVYGTSPSNRGTSCDGGNGCGTVFTVSPEGTVTTLYTFKGGTDGAAPGGGVIMDRLGNLYGTTSGGGTYGFGTVYKLAPDGVETVLYSFHGGEDGDDPLSELVEDSSGNLYGTTGLGGGTGCDGYGCGTVFSLAPDGTETVLHAFTGGSDGSYPASGLVRDRSGNLYGTTNAQEWDCPNAPSCGTVFRITPEGAETVLYTFAPNEGPPNGGLYVDKHGNLFGTAGGWKDPIAHGSNPFEHGVVYELVK